MGFIAKAIGKAIVKKAGEAAMYGVVAHEEKTRSVDALVNKSTANYMLFIKKKSMSIKRGFTVCDEFDKKKYVVKTDALTFGYPCIRLYDMEENENNQRMQISFRKTLFSNNWLIVQDPLLSTNYLKRA